MLTNEKVSAAPSLLSPMSNTGPISSPQPVSSPNQPTSRKPKLNSVHIVLILVLLLILAGLVFFIVKPRLFSPKVEQVTSKVLAGKEAYIPQYYKDSEVPIFPEAEVKVLIDGDHDYGLELRSKETYPQVRDFYKGQLVLKGWKVDIAQETEVMTLLSANKDKKYANITITKTLVYEEVKKDSPKRKVTDGDTLIKISINKGS